MVARKKPMRQMLCDMATGGFSRDSDVTGECASVLLVTLTGVTSLNESDIIPRVE
jgi:hypothetical protein